MKKWIFGTVIFLVLAASGVAFWYYFVELPGHELETIQVFPENPIFIAEIPAGQDSNDSLSGNFIRQLEEQPIGKFLMRTSAVGKFLSGKNIASEVFADSLVRASHKNAAFNVGAYITGAGDFEYLFAWKKTEDQVFSETIEGSVFDGVNILSYEQNKKTWYFFQFENLIAGSFSRILIEDAVQHLYRKKSISKNPEFEKLAELPGEVNGIRIFLNYRILANYISMFAGSEISESISMIAAFAEWSALDINILESSLLLSGYTSTSGDNFLNRFKTFDTADIRTPMVLPANTRLMWRMGGANSAISASENSRESSWHSWMGGELTFAITEVLDDQVDRYALFALYARDVNAADSTLASLSIADGQAGMFSIRKLKPGQTISSRFGKGLTRFDNAWFTRLGRYLVFAADRSTLERTVLAYSSGNTLANDPEYREFQDHFPSSANAYLYLSPSGLENLASKYILERYRDSLEQIFPIYTKIRPLAIQFDRYRDMFLTSCLLNYNDSPQNRRDHLWTISLNTPLASAPALVKNHRNKQMEVIAQDQNNDVYLVSRAGELRWKKNLDGPILGQVHQIDYYKNGKLQYLFNTEQKMYLVDLNGNDVADFPLNLTAGASCGLALFDYENNLDYRIFVGGKNGHMYGYYKTGKPLQGWSPLKNTGNIEATPIHFLTKGKDYIAFASDKGTVYLKDRRGKDRFKPVKCETYFLAPIIGDPERASEAVVACDTTGTIYRIGIDGKATRDQIASVTQESAFSAVDLDGKPRPEFIFINSNTLEMRENNGEKSWEARLPDNSGNELMVFGSGPDALIGVLSSKTGEWNLFDTSGNSPEGFPMTGNSLFTVGPLTGKSDKVLLGGVGNSLIAVSLP